MLPPRGSALKAALLLTQALGILALMSNNKDPFQVLPPELLDVPEVGGGLAADAPNAAVGRLNETFAGNRTQYAYNKTSGERTAGGLGRGLVLTGSRELSSSGSRAIYGVCIPTPGVLAQGPPGLFNITSVTTSLLQNK